MKKMHISEDLDSLASLLLMELFGVELTCNCCGAQFSDRVAKSFKESRRILCSKCGWKGNWRDSTLLACSKLESVKFLVFYFKFGFPDHTGDLAKALNVNHQTVRWWRSKINEFRLNGKA